MILSSEAQLTDTPRDPGRRVRVLGYLRDGAADGLDCDQPLHVAVSHGVPAEPGYLEWRELWRCSAHRESRCKPCSERYRKRVRAVAAEGLWRREGFYYLLTVTAPGSRAHCKRAGCSGDGANCAHERCRCTPPGGVDLAAWNPTAGKRWNSLRSALSGHYRTRFEYFRAVEVQEGEHRADGCGRGALHLHVLLWSPRKLAVRTVRRLAIGSGFGHSVKLDALTPGSKNAAYYVSKYVTKAGDSRESVPWAREVAGDATAAAVRAARRPTYRTWSQSVRWGTTMKAIRAAAFQRWIERDVADVLDGTPGTAAALALATVP